jgi:hypothetical protein
MNSVAIIIVTNDHAFCVEKCLTSVVDSEEHLPEIIVVDNDSADETPAIVSRHGSFVKLVQRHGRHSLSNNLNVALESLSADYVLILNPDIVLPHGAITGLARFLDTHGASGACASALVFPDGRLQLSCRRFPTPWSVVLRRTPLRALLSYADRGRGHLMADIDHDHAQEVDWVLGACVMFRMAALRAVGLFDEGFRLYCEDIDICYRLWKSGWSVNYNPEIQVVHEHRALSDKQLVSKHSLWHYRSMLHYFCKHGRAGFRRPAASL